MKCWKAVCRHNDGGRRPRHLIDCSLQLSTFLPLTASTFFHLYSTEHHFSAISDIRTHSFIFSFPLPSSSSVMQSKCRHAFAQRNFSQRLPHLHFCWTHFQSGSFKLRQQLFLSLFTNMSGHFLFFTHPNTTVSQLGPTMHPGAKTNASWFGLVCSKDWSSNRHFLMLKRVLRPVRMLCSTYVLSKRWFDKFAQIEGSLISMLLGGI